MKRGQVKIDAFSSSSNLGKFSASKERSSHKKESTVHYIHIEKNTILTFLYHACTLYNTTPFRPITVGWKLAWVENTWPTVIYVWVENQGGL